MSRPESRPFRVCPVCGGSLQDSLDDPGWVKCFACSRSFDAQTIAGASTVASSPPTDPEGPGDDAAAGQQDLKKQQGVKGRWAQRAYVRRTMH